MRLSPNFTLVEAMKSQTAVRLGIDNTPPAWAIPKLKAVALGILQPVRNHYGIGIIPSSWWRSAALCIAIGSSNKSQHAKGEAVDFEVHGVSNYEVAEWIIENLTFDQLILEYYEEGDPNSGWIHCSLVEDRENRGEVLRYSGGNYYRGLP